MATKVKGKAKGASSISLNVLGNSGLQYTGPYVYEEFLPDLRWPQAARVYKEMSSNDAVIGAILYLAEMLIRGTSWSVKPASESEADEAAAKFLKECMDDMEISWADTISEILSMFTYGFSFHEIVYKVRRGPKETNLKYKSEYSDGKFGWRCLPIRSQQSFNSWIFDKNGTVIGFEQVSDPHYIPVVIPMSKALLFRTQVRRNNPEGKSLLRNAYRSWFFKKHFEEIEGIGIERDLAGFPVLKAPDGMDIWNDKDPNMAKIRQDAEALVASIRRDSQEGLLLPSGWDLSLLASKSGRQINVSEIIERYDKRIAMTLLSDVILLGSSSNGSFALADTKRSLLAAALQSQLLSIADVFNKKAVPDLFNINSFKDLTGLPKIVPGQIHTPSLKELALLLRSMGLKIAGDKEMQDYLRRLISAPDLDNETFASVYQTQAPGAGTEQPKGKVVSTKIPGQETEEQKYVNRPPDDTVDNDLEGGGDYTGGE